MGIATKHTTTLLATLLALLVASASACSNSSGGQHSGRNGKQQTGNGKNADQTPGGDDASAGGNGNAGGGEEGAGEGEGEGEGSGNGGADGAMSDAEICKFLKAAGSAAQVAGEIEYLCEKGGLKALRAAPEGKMTVLTDAKEGAFSHFMMAGSMPARGTIDAAVEIGRVYCRSFDEFRELVGAAAVKDIESITPSNASDAGCDFDFVGKKIVLFQPKFRGKSRAYSNQRISVGMTYLVEKISLVEAATALNIAVQEGDKLRAYTVQTSKSDTKGLHGTAKTALISANEEGFRAFASALQKLGD